MPGDLKPTFIDRLVSIFSPEKAAKRMQWRAYVDSPEFKNSYRGGVKTRLDPSWSRSQSYRGNNSSDRTRQFSMRDRGRRVYAESYVGRSIIDTETNYVIGDGMTLQVRTSSKPFNREVEQKFAAFMDGADIRGMLDGTELQRMFYRSSRIDGDGGGVLVDRGGEPKVQLIPGDLIQNPDGKQQPLLIDGVETNNVGKPIRYHLLTLDELGRRQFTHVPASNFLYLPWLRETLHVRGETCFATVFELLDQLDGYTDAVGIAARMAAVFGLIFKETTAAKQFGALGTVANSKGDQQRAITMENGQVKFVGPDGDVVQVQASQPMSQTPDFIRAMMRLIGLPFGMPLEVVAKDVSTSNLSALRGIRQEYAKACRPKAIRFARRVMAPLYLWWLAREIKAKRIVTPAPEDLGNHLWMPSKNEFTDKLAEAQAALLEISMGINSPQRVTAELGRDYEQLQEEIEQANAMRTAKKLPIAVSTFVQQPGKGTPEAGKTPKLPASDDDAGDNPTEPKEHTDAQEQDEA